MTHGIPTAAGWLALSDQPAPSAEASLSLPQAQFTMEIALPIAPGPVLLDLRSEEGLPRVFSVFLDRQIGLAVMQRQGDSLVRHLLRGPLPDRAGTARMSYAWDMAADRWTLALTLPQGDVLRAEGIKPMAPRLSDLQTLCKPDTRRHPSVLWFGVTRGAALPDPGPWIGMATPVLTDHGLRPAGSLQPGNNRIAVWTRPSTTSTTWSYSAQFGTQGSGDSNFSVPTGVFVSADTLTAWVADSGNNRIAIWTHS